jgi:hypothetical protein
MDITVNIPVTAISYTTWLRTSYIGFGLVDEKGNSLVSTIEIGPDQKDFFQNIMEQAAREVLKSFVTRQGDVNGVPFSYDGTNVIYRFNECEPVLVQADALKSELTEDVRNALFTYVTMKWFSLKGNEKYATLFVSEFADLQRSIQGILHRLHD